MTERKPKSPYQRYNKKPRDYASLYKRAPHLRHFVHNDIGQGSYAPHVNNPHYREGRRHD